MRKGLNYSDLKEKDIKDTTNYTGPLKNQIGKKQCLGIMIRNTLTFTNHIPKVSINQIK